MTAADSMYRGFGKLHLPLAPSLETDLSALDPASDILRELIAAALTAELTPVWANAVAGTPLEGRGVVQCTFPLFPEQVFLQQAATEWPLLAVYRADEPETFDEFTLWEQRVTTKWGVDYCLGSLEVGNFAKLNAVLTAVPRIVDSVIRAGGHLAYAAQQSGNTSFAKQVLGEGDGCCGFSTIRVVQSVSGTAAFAQNGPKFHCASVVLETTELSSINPGVATPYKGTSATLSTGDTTGLTPVVIGDSAVPLK